jgi:hypothetical protein
MRPATTNSPLHNPFKNRFHDPVTWRLDEMQAHSNVVWLQQRKHDENDGPSAEINENFSLSDMKSDGGMYTGIFAFFFVLLASAVVLFRAI